MFEGPVLKALNRMEVSEVLQHLSRVEYYDLTPELAKVSFEAIRTFSDGQEVPPSIVDPVLLDFTSFHVLTQTWLVVIDGVAVFATICQLAAQDHLSCL